MGLMYQAGAGSDGAMVSGTASVKEGDSCDELRRCGRRCGWGWIEAFNYDDGGCLRKSLILDISSRCFCMHDFARLCLASFIE